MTFFSAKFFFVLLGFFTAYYLIRNPRAQLYALLGFSTWFYLDQAGSVFFVLLLCCLVTTLCSAVCLSGDFSARLKKSACAIGVTANLGILFLYKYGALVGNTLLGPAASRSGLASLLWLPLPVGISFYIFHGISLLVDSLTGQYKDDLRLGRPRELLAHAERTFLYLIFFPQLIAGPISKARMFMPQVQRKSFRAIEWDGALKHLISGYFYKFVVANNLADWTVRADPKAIGSIGSADLLVLHFAYSMQIFADFAGYSSIAIGLAALFGYRLPENFNFPYIARSMSDFWRRWHMSLSSWLRDYLYIPLGGNRKGVLRTYVNLIVTMGLGGLWHGASWNFLAWGLGHGTALSTERALGLRGQEGASPRRSSLIGDAARIVFIFSLVTALWIPFRYRSVADSLNFIDGITHRWHGSIDLPEFLSIALLSLPIIVAHAWQYAVERWNVKLAPYAASSVYGALLFFTVTNSGVGVPFIYFQF